MNNLKSLLQKANNPMDGFSPFGKLAALLVLILFFVGCNKENGTEYKDLLQGTWINTHVDDALVETDQKFIMQFTDNKEYYSEGVVFDSLRKKWIDSRPFDYSVSDDRILISGIDIQNNALDLEYGIISIGAEELVCRVNSLKINGLEQNDPKIYKFKKALRNFKAEIVGAWYGKSTHAGSTDNDYHYWNYLPNGTYEYYYRDNPGSSQWIKKPDNEGGYYLYDNLLATNWSNDIFSGVTGLAYECWEIEIIGNTMKWTGYRSNGQITSYEMVRVPGPPG